MKSGAGGLKAEDYTTPKKERAQPSSPGPSTTKKRHEMPLLAPPVVPPKLGENVGGATSGDEDNRESDCDDDGDGVDEDACEGAHVALGQAGGAGPSVSLAGATHQTLAEKLAQAQTDNGHDDDDEDEDEADPTLTQDAAANVALYDDYFADPSDVPDMTS